MLTDCGVTELFNELYANSFAPPYPFLAIIAGLHSVLCATHIYEKMKKGIGELYKMKLVLRIATKLSNYFSSVVS